MPAVPGQGAILYSMDTLPELLPQHLVRHTGNILRVRGRSQYRCWFCAVLVSVLLVFACGEEEKDTRSTGRLVISEVGSRPTTTSPGWIEVYNTGTEVAHLARYQLRCYGMERIYPYTARGIVTFSLPEYVVQPGAYLLLRGRTSDFLRDGSQVCYLLQDGSVVPFWNEGGFVELLVDGGSFDFMRFGGDTTAPAAGGFWNGDDVAALPLGGTNYGFSLARDGSNTDTDDAADWTLLAFSTAGGPNDVTSDADNDGDGIPDCSEEPGGTFSGMPLYAWGARTNQKDIFSHIDYMDSADPAVIPTRRALDLVVAAFAARGFAVHFDVGDLFHQAVGSSPADYDLDDGNHRVPFAAGITIGWGGGGLANLYDYKNSYMPVARKQVFHYLLFAYSQSPDGTHISSGLAELYGNDFLVSLGNAGLTNDSERERTLLENLQAATVMHELGHNLGLRHGGDQDLNYKPNYVSIMNYLYQIYGLPAIGTNEGDRYYLEMEYGGLKLSNLVDSPYTTNFRLDYSDGSGSVLDEDNLDESLGLGRSGSTSVDFNLNGSSNDNSLAWNINPDGDSMRSQLQDYDDWANLYLFFQRTSDGDESGRTLLRTVWSDAVGDDQQPVVQERPISHLIKP